MCVEYVYVRVDLPNIRIRPELAGSRCRTCLVNYSNRFLCVLFPLVPGFLYNERAACRRLHATCYSVNELYCAGLETSQSAYRLVSLCEPSVLARWTEATRHSW